MKDKTCKRILSLSLPQSLVSQLKTVAANEEISLSGLVEAIVTDWIDAEGASRDASSLKTRIRHRYAKGQLLLGFMAKWKPRKRKNAEVIIKK